MASGIVAGARLAPLLLILMSGTAFAADYRALRYVDEYIGGGYYSYAQRLSRDGTAVVGDSSNSDGTLNWSEPYIWTPATGIVPLGTLGAWTNDYRSGLAYGVSSDGSVVVGGSTNSDGTSNWNEAFRWTAVGGMDGLGFINPFPGYSYANSNARDVSGDGSVVVGQSSNAFGTEVWDEAFRWTEIDGMTGLGVLGNQQVNVASFPDPPDYQIYHGSSTALYVSADGSTIIGTSNNTDNTNYWTEGFRWTGPGPMQGLGVLGANLDGTRWSDVTGISADGSVITGNSSNAAGADYWREAYRWTSGPGMEGLGYLGPTDPAGQFAGHGASSSFGVSADGSTIVGYTSMSDGTLYWDQAFVWDEVLGMRALDLPSLIGDVIDTNTYVSHAFAASADGQVIVGNALEFDGTAVTDQAMIWDAATGEGSTIRSRLAASSIDTTGWNFYRSTGVSDDGQVVAGVGSNPDGATEAWYYSNNAIITPDIVTDSFAALAEMVQRESSGLDATLATQAMLAGQQCRFADDGSDRPYCFFGSGVGTIGDDDARSLTVTVGLAVVLTPDLSVGVSLNAGTAASDLVGASYYGASHIGASAYLAYQPDIGPQLLAAVTAGSSDLEITRAYTNANTPVSSMGSTEGGGIGLLLNAGWALPVTDSLTVKPYVSYSLTQFLAEGWSETGGPFPADIESIAQDSQIVRVGLRAELDLPTRGSLWAGLALAHRIEAEGPAVSGEIAPGEFMLPGAALPQDWLEAEIGLSQPIGEAITATASLGISGQPGSAAISARVGFGFRF